MNMQDLSMNVQDLRANPYVGLRPFFEDDSLYFFGREAQTAELLDILRKQRFLGVVGSSGSGKSSLVYAGLLPALLGGFLVGDSDRWRIVKMKPGSAPIFNLATGLQVAMGRTVDERNDLNRALRDDHAGAVIEFLKPQLKSNENVFLLVDQFEELFAFRGVDRDDDFDRGDRQRAVRKAEAADLVDLIMALADQRSLPIYVVLTMRTDFLGDCDLFYGLPEALNRGRYLVPRLTREQLRDAIECPALLKPDAQIAPRLIDHLLNELGDRFDRLPVLQHALMRTWDAWKRAGGTGLIDLRNYDKAGQLAGALDLDAESALEGLDERVTSRVFKRLTKTDMSQRRVRDPARISELIAASGADRAVIDDIIRHFKEDGRSFVHTSSEEDPSDPRVDISHESLIRQWARLRNWVDEERESRDRYIELAARAQKWKRDEAGLLSGPELRSYTDWSAREALTPGWARRYVDSADALESARLYLAEAELQRRWEKPWQRLILVTLVIAGVLLVMVSRDHVRDRVKQLDDYIQAAWRSGDPWTWFVATSYLSLLSGVALACFGACIGVMRLGQWIYRKITLPRILEAIASSGETSARDAEAKVEPRDPAVVNNTIYATTLRRVGGFCLDFCLQSVVAIALLVFALIIDSSSIWSGIALVTAIVCFNWWYSVLQVASKRQATLGMRLLGIYRTDLSGARPSIARATVWWVARLLLSTPPYGLGFVLQLVMPRGQTLHDWLSGTVVLLRSPATAPDSTRSVSASVSPRAAL